MRLADRILYVFVQEMGSFREKFGNLDVFGGLGMIG